MWLIVRSGAKPVVNREDFIKVVCDNCGEEFKEQIGRLKDRKIFICPHCMANLESDPHELNIFIRKELENDLAFLSLYVIEG